MILSVLRGCFLYLLEAPLLFYVLLLTVMENARALPVTISVLRVSSHRKQYYFWLLMFWLCEQFHKLFLSPIFS